MRKVNRHLLPRFLMLTMLCYLVGFRVFHSAARLQLWPARGSGMSLVCSGLAAEQCSGVRQS